MALCPRFYSRMMRFVVLSSSRLSTSVLKSRPYLCCWGMEDVSLFYNARIGPWLCRSGAAVASGLEKFLATAVVADPAMGCCSSGGRPLEVVILRRCLRPRWRQAYPRCKSFGAIAAAELPTENFVPLTTRQDSHLLPGSQIFGEILLPSQLFLQELPMPNCLPPLRVYHGANVLRLAAVVGCRAGIANLHAASHARHFGVCMADYCTC